jgi:predicted transcriptional regulator
MLIFFGLGVAACYVLLLIIGRQLRAARALLGMAQIELSKRSRVAIGTIRRMESFDGEVGARTSTLSQVQKTLEKAGVEFLNDGQPGVRLRRVGR